MRRLALVIATASLFAATSAQAQPPPPYEGCGDGDCRPAERSSTDGLDLQVAVAMMVGGYGIGGHSDGAAGVAVQLGRRWDDWLLYGEYDGLCVGGDELRDGLLHRAGGALRRDVLDFGKRLSGGLWAGGVLWLEAGAGFEASRWNGGHRVDRGDLSLGIGGEYRIVFGGDRPRLLGVYYAARFLIADAPPPTSTAALCVDGCDVAPGTGRDLGVFFVGGLTFGR